MCVCAPFAIEERCDLQNYFSIGMHARNEEMTNELMETNKWPIS